MKKSDVQIGQVYLVKVSNQLVPVRIDKAHDSVGWVGTNSKTGKSVRIKSAQRLRRHLAEPKAQLAARAVEPPAAEPVAEPVATEPTTAGGAAGSPARRLSCLAAAEKVLAEAGEPLNCLELCNRMHKAGYWSSDAPTPQNTLYAAILRQIQKKGSAARFRKVGRGQFELAKEA